MQRGPESIQTLRLLNALRKQSKKGLVWKRVAYLIARPARKKAEVSLTKVSKFTKKDDVVIIPGKLLSSGILTHSVKIACLRSSKAALVKTKAAGAKVITIAELMKENPSGSKTRILV